MNKLYRYLKIAAVVVLTCIAPIAITSCPAEITANSAKVVKVVQTADAILGRAITELKIIGTFVQGDAKTTLVTIEVALQAVKSAMNGVATFIGIEPVMVSPVAMRATSLNDLVDDLNKQVDALKSGKK